MKKPVLLLFLLAASAYSFAQNNLTFRSNFPYPGKTLANIWGYVDAFNNEYALVGTSEGMSIVDVTDPDNPVEKFAVAGPTSQWREIRTKGKYAFVTTEGGTNGLQIVDLSGLPAFVNVSYWSPTISGTKLKTIHALQVDGNYLYLYGSNIGQGGAIVADVTNPAAPFYVGQYNVAYIHDGFVRHDTLYGGQIYAGQVAIVNMKNKSAPVLLATQSTPGAFTHNTWLSDDSKYLFTTDEVDNSFLTSYDISDLSNIKELDRIQTNPGSNAIVHNTYYKNGFNVTSWYKEGVIITDVSRPDNMVITGSYDTYAQGSGSGFNGCWGVYPFLPSGNIIASDMNNGLYVLTPTYVHACYLEGAVRDSNTNALLSNVLVEIIGTNVTEHTDAGGNYKCGTASAASYSIRYSKSGYYTKTLTGIALQNGIVNTQNVLLVPIVGFNVNGNVVKATDNSVLAQADILVESANYSYHTLSDASGNFVVPNVFPDVYTITAGKWGYVTQCTSQSISPGSGALALQLKEGYYDDFTFDFGWKESGSATTGKWVRAFPVGTDYNGGSGNANPGVDVSTDCGGSCYVTGNGGGTYAFDDVDNGNTRLVSSTINLSSYLNPYISYYRWFFDVFSGATPPNDTLRISISNGSTTAVLETTTALTSGSSIWKFKKFRIKDYISLSSNMSLIVETADWIQYGGNPTESAFDKMVIIDSVNVGIDKVLNEGSDFEIYPNPSNGKSQLFYHGAVPGSPVIVYDLMGRAVYREMMYKESGMLNVPASLSKGIYFIENAGKGMKFIKTE